MNILSDILNALNDFVVKQPFLALIIGAIFGALVSPIFRPFFRIIKNALTDWWTRRSKSSLSGRIRSMENELASVTKYHDNPELLSRLFQSTVLEVLSYIGFGLFTNAILFFIGGILASLVFGAASARALKAWQIYKNVEDYQTYKSETERKLQELQDLLKQRQTTP